MNTDEVFNALDSTLPKHGWRVKLNHVYPEKRDQSVTPKLHQIPPFVTLGLRYFFWFLKKLIQRRKPIMNYLKMPVGKQIYGVPIGGIGCGTIGRGFKGEFCRYQLRPGLYTYHVVPANQFIVTIKDESQTTIYQQVLSPHSCPKGQLSSWKWEYNGADATYCGLYPQSWTEYNIPEHKIRLVCKQISPVIPHNYKDSSLPVAIFKWTIENNSADVKHVSITFVFQSGTGRKKDRLGGFSNEAFEKTDSGVTVSGTLIHQTISGMECTYGIAGRVKDGVKVTKMINFNPSGNGSELWNDLYEDGELKLSTHSSYKTRKGEDIASAVCIKSTVIPNCHQQAQFALTWDMPKIHFTGMKREHYRYYTKWFGKEGNAAPALIHYAMANCQKWEKEIHKWQEGILNDTKLPDWYKSAIFNELYYVSDGGSVWLDAEEEFKDTDDPRVQNGRFAYLESHEYRMYNTYDVHFYASFALAMLWPKLQLCIQYDIRDYIGMEDTTRRSHWFNGKVAHRKSKNSVPHDIGDPDEEPFVAINAYCTHDVAEWRDLNLKFVLQVFRDFHLTKDVSYLKAMWASCKCVMEKAQSWDLDKDGIIENAGSADQTYDSWIMKGTSAYCGGLWLAALHCTKEMAKFLGDSGEEDKYLKLLQKGTQSYEEKLWNGSYYNFDSSNSSHSKSIMSDQLCGHWYLKASGVSHEVFPATHVKKALETIYNFNVLKFKNGTMGAVNGMTPEGKVDDSTVQSEEVWTGVVYALSALMIHEGMISEAFKTAEGIYRTVYERIGMAFETPEALYAEKHYRAIGYMRPLSIWAIQHAINERKNNCEAESVHTLQ